MRIGIFGGSFDPPHRAHLDMATQASERIPLDALYFVPSFQSPLKQQPAVAPAHHRIAMVQLLAGLRPEWQVISYEMDQKRMVPTIETVEYLMQENPRVSFYLIIGGDQAAQFTGWREWKRLAGLVHIVCFAREGTPPVAPFAANFTYVPYNAQLASTTVREQLQKGAGTEDCLPPVVQSYIKEHRLYL